MSSEGKTGEPKAALANATARPELRCIEEACGASYAITEVRAECARCGNLLDVRYDWPKVDASAGTRLYICWSQALFGS